MRIEILGSGGATTTPRPGCSCRVCLEARERGVPYSRTGPSVFVHGPDVLVDTPEESKQQLVRAGVERVPIGLYSHWHPDHTSGRRVWESLNFDFRAWPRRTFATSDIYLPERVARDFGEWLGLRAHFEYLERRLGVVRMHVVAEGESIRVGETTITPVRLAEEYSFAYLFEAGGRRALIAMDELVGWDPPDLGPLDLALLPMGIVEHDPFTGERRIPADHPLLASEATFPQTLEIAAKLDAKRVVLAHIEEMDGLGHDDLRRLGERERLEFAYDTMLIEL
jgi:phosphoribosyl 1,2-cyclic phosphate phosphodiesterase